MSELDLEDKSGQYKGCHPGCESLVTLFDSFHCMCTNCILGDNALHQACEQGWLDIVKLFIEKYGYNLDMRSVQNYRCPLHCACEYGHVNIVDYLIEEGCNPLLRDMYGLEPLDYAIKNDYTVICYYICKYCISSAAMLDGARSKTTINLVKLILQKTPFNPNWKSADGDNILQVVFCSTLIWSYMSPHDIFNILNLIEVSNIGGHRLNIPQLVCCSESCVSCIPTVLLCEWLNCTNLNISNLISPNWRTADDNSLLEIICQSKVYLSRLSSAVILRWLTDISNDIFIYDLQRKTADSCRMFDIICQLLPNEFCNYNVKLKTSDIPIGAVITPHWETDDGDKMLKVLFKSELFTSHLSSPLLLKWLSKTTLDLERIIVPNWKTADGSTLLQLIFQSKQCVLHISSAVILKWLIASAVNVGKSIVPNWTTSDGSSILKLVCHSQKCLSQISSTVLVDWLSDSTVDLMKVIVPNLTTADGDTVHHLICNSDKCLSRISSTVVSDWLNDTTFNLMNFVSMPDCKTASGHTVFDIICQRESKFSCISSATLLNWLSTTTVDILLNSSWKTADSDTVVQVASNIESVVSVDSIMPLSLLLTDTPLDVIITPHWEIADGIIALRVLFRSKLFMSHISSPLLLKWLVKTTLDLEKIVVHNWKTADGDTLLELIFHSELCVSHILSFLMLEWLVGSAVNLAKLIVPNWKTADGDSLLQLVCQSRECVSRLSSVVLSKWLADTSSDLLVPQLYWKTADHYILFEIVCQLQLSTASKNFNVCYNDNTLDVIITPYWETDDGDVTLQVLFRSELFMSHTSSSLLLKWFHKTSLDLERIVVPQWRTADGETLLELIFHSESCVSRISSALMLEWLVDNTVNLAELILPNWRTADRETLLELIFHSESCVSRISSALMSEWLLGSRATLAKLILPNWKTADGETLLELIFHSESYVSDISSALMLEWLVGSTENLAKFIVPNWKTADGDSLLQLVCQSRECVSRLSSVVLSKWLADTSSDLFIPELDWKTTDYYRLFKIVCQLQLSTSSKSFSKCYCCDTSLDVMACVTPHWETDDGDVTLQVIFISELFMSHMSSSLLLKWFHKTTLDLAKIVVPQWKTADGETLLEVIFKSESCVSRISSALMLEWLVGSTVNPAELILPNWKTADGETLLELIIQSESYMSRISSALMLVWLMGSTVNPAELILPNWKTADGETLLELIFQSESYVSHISSALMLNWLVGSTENLAKLTVPNWKTADGDSLLQLVCQSHECVSHLSSVVLSKWLADTSSDLLIPKLYWTTTDDHRLYEIVCQLQLRTPSKSFSMCSSDTSLDVITCITPHWETDDGDVTLQVIFISELFMSYMSSSLLLKWFHKTTLDLAKIVVPQWKTADGDTLLGLIFQSESCVSRISSALMLEWLVDSTVNPAELILPNWKTADGETLLELIFQSESYYVSRISSALMLEWLVDSTVNPAELILPNWKTSDGETLLEIIFQSESYVSHISSALMLDWLVGSTENLAKFIVPNWKTADGDSLLQLVCQSHECVLHLSSVVLSKWLADTSSDLLIPKLYWTTTDDHRLYEIVCQLQLRIPSKSFSMCSSDTSLDVITCITPHWETDDGDVTLQVIFISELFMSYMSSSLLLKWFHKTTLDLAKIVVPQWKTADGDTLLEVIFQSESCVSRISSALMLEWLVDSTVNPAELILPNWKTADGETLLELIFQSESYYVSRISSALMLEWLVDSTVNPAELILPNWKTSDGETLLEIIFQSESYVSHISSALMLDWLVGSIENLAKFIVPNWKTADGDSLLQLVCQSHECVLHLSSVVLSKWLADTTSDLLIPKLYWKTADDYRLYEIVCQLQLRTPSKSFSMCSSDTSLDVITCITPHWETDDGDVTLQVIFISELFMSYMSSSLLLKWFHKTTLDLAKIVVPQWKTGDGDTLLEVIFQSESCVSHISSAVMVEWLVASSVNLAKFIVPNWKTADGDVILQLVCQLHSCISHLPSVVMSKWISETTVSLLKIIMPNQKTADGDNILQLVCQSKECLIRTSSTVMSKLLNCNNIVTLNLMNIVPVLKTADGDTLFQLTCQSKKKVSYLSSSVILKWLSYTDKAILTVMHTVNPNWTTTDGHTIFHLLCLCNMKDEQIIKIVNSFLRKGVLYPNIRDGDDNTALHLVSRAGKSIIVRFLLFDVQCDPNVRNKEGLLALEMTTDPETIIIMCQYKLLDVPSKAVETWMNSAGLIDVKSMIRIFKTILQNQNLESSNKNTLLHITCRNEDVFRYNDIMVLVDYLLTEAICDLNCINNDGKMPLQLTSDIRIIAKLVKHGAKVTSDVVFKLVSQCPDYKLLNEVLAVSTTKGTLLWNPYDLNVYGNTALHIACECDKPAVVHGLLKEGHCNAHMTNRRGQQPIDLATSLETIAMLIKHGARVTPELVLKFEAMENIQKDLLFEVVLTTWNPDDKDKHGNTALHLACIGDKPAAVKLLLLQAHCNPNIKNSDEKVPLQITTNPEIIKDLIRYGAQTSIMYESCKSSLHTSEPIKPPVKVFIVGNPFVGKSTLTAALKKKLNIVSRLFTSGKVSGVDRKTVGIVPHELESDVFGRITVYDFAGHREFYSGHAALLQIAIQSTPPIFLLVINLCDDEEKIVVDILYWISFLENQCTLVSCKPHIIVVGSHADRLKSTGVNLKNKVATIKRSLHKEYFVNLDFIDFVAMDCQYHESAGMSDLRLLLARSCNKLRIQEPITFNAHCFLVYLIDKFHNLPAITVSTLFEHIQNAQSSKNEEADSGIWEFLPVSFGALYRICVELNDRGHILFLKDKVNIESSYVVIDKISLLSEVSGTVFAPEGFKQYRQLSTNTGVVSLSKIAECFPAKDLKVLIGFLTHLEFCHEISNQALCQVISEQYSKTYGEHYYLFPALISVKASNSVWEAKSNFEHTFGWSLRCTKPEQFLSSRFLQVLLLRLAFSLALELSCDNDDHNLGIHRKCSLWKNGIFWGREFGMEILVEVIDDKLVIIMARFQSSNLVKCLKHRTEVIHTVLECIEEFCPRISTVESFFNNSSALEYPFALNSERVVCTVQDLATAILSNCESPSVVLGCGNAVPAAAFLSFEPYTEMEADIIKELWNKNNEKKTISDTFLLRCVQKTFRKLDWFIKIFNESCLVPCNKDNLFQELTKWRDHKESEPMTYKDLRLKLDMHSVFAERNILNLAGGKFISFSVESVIVEEEKTKEKVKLVVQGESPKLHELQLLKLGNGKEIRIIEMVAPHWKKFATALCFNQARIKSVEMGSHYQPEDACREIFSSWLDGAHDLKPVTWNSLIQCLKELKEAKVVEAVDMLSNMEITDEEGTLLSLSEDNNFAFTTPTVLETNAKAKPDDCLKDERYQEIPLTTQKCSVSINIKQLELLEGRGQRKVKIIESIESQWEEVAVALGVEEDMIDTIKSTHSQNHLEACRAMLATWLESNADKVSWPTFIQGLIDAGLPDLADNLDEILKL